MRSNQRELFETDHLFFEFVDHMDRSSHVLYKAQVEKSNLEEWV